MIENRARENERLYLGSLLIDIEQAGDGIATKLTADCFQSGNYKRIFETIQKQCREGTTPTIATLCHELTDINPADIADLTSAVPSAANLVLYENEIYNTSKDRLFDQALQIAQQDRVRGTNTDTIIKNLIPALAGVTNARNEARIKSAAELLKTQFPPIRWIVPELIGEGLTMFVGAPKVGKSWFALNLSIAASSGGRFLGNIKTDKTDTLYLALEDTERRLHDRLKKLETPALDNLNITTQWRDGYMGLENYLKAHSGIGLVIIDTLARFASIDNMIDDMNDYTKTTAAMASLKRIADDLKIAMLVIHHTKKGKVSSKKGEEAANGNWMEAALGSTGLTGAADSIIYIDRPDRNNICGILHLTGRDTEDITRNLKLDLKCGGWTITDNGKSSKNKKYPPKPDNWTGTDEEYKKLIDSRGGWPL